MKELKTAIKYLFIAALTAAVLTMPTTMRYGVDGVQYIKKIPLYAKACGFIYRDWAYRDITKSIVKDEKDGAKKALLILEWVNSNIKPEVPEGFKIVDDHPLNIITRQYGCDDQLEDVFTILCSYAGMRAGMARCYRPDSNNYITLSFVEVDGRWLVFDAERNRYFLNTDNRIADIGDILNKKISLKGGDRDYYSGYFPGLKDVKASSFTRAEEQMPLRRLKAEIGRLFKR